MATCGGLDSGFVPGVQDFDKKLTEADAYLQILIEQLKLFDDKLQNCKDDEQRKKSGTLKETANSMIPRNHLILPCPMEQVMLTFSIHMMIEMMKGRQGWWKSTRVLSCICCHRLGLEWILLLR
uniref:Uncharacterized protein n=1 Tax=Balaenoptera musculus TaxID=9771 RepID=A0A8C0HZ48_BALMU